LQRAAGHGIDEAMKLDDLDNQEQLVLGALVRLMLRADGKFTESEEKKVNGLGERLGAADRIWSVVSASAQAFPDDDAMRLSVTGITNADVRKMVRAALADIADDGDVAPAEKALLDWLDGVWK
jgi:hypothetical protein